MSQTNSSRSSSRYLLPYAEITWQEGFCPYSPLFDDIYWSRAKSTSDKFAGFAEKDHVFIKGNKLEHRWENLNEHDEFTILETGFGFGLNFILSLELKDRINSDFTLQYIAFEQFPVSPTDLIKLNEELKNPWLEKLISLYPPPIPGMHHIWLRTDICLTLIIGDIVDTLPSLIAKVDACFLDGFSPSKNKSMWEENLYERLSVLLSAGASCSSYSVAGHVRRGLAQTGLEISKIPGYANKAEMLFVKKGGEWIAKRKLKKDITIIGAGLAGLFCAWALDKRKISYRILDSSNKPLGCVQDISQIGIYPQLSAAPSGPANYSLHAFNYVKNHLGYEQSGRLKIIDSEAELEKAAKLAAHFPSSIVSLINSDSAGDISGIPIENSALYFPQAGWINPLSISEMIINNIEYSYPCDTLRRKDNKWEVSNKRNQSHSSDIVILATGANTFSMLDNLNLVPVRGQGLRLKLATVKLKTIIDNQVSLFPLQSQNHTVSATFGRNDLNQVVTIEDTQWLLDKLNSISNAVVSDIDAQVGHRMTTRDRMPVSGQLPNWSLLEEYCESSRRQKFTDFEEDLYCATGFGSHGATLGPYCAELLIRQINDEPRAEASTLTSALRFAFRDSGTKF